VRTQGRARRLAARGVDQVGHRLGLREVQLAFEVRAARELARLGEARARVEAGGEQRLHHDRTAVSLQLQHRLAGIGMRGRKVERDALVQLREGREGRQARLGQTAQDLARDARHLGTGNA
jgi:hypothetical protein